MRADHWLFSYGTLRQADVQRALFGRIVDGYDDILPGFTIGSLRITDPDVVALSGAAVHPVLRRGGPDDRVKGSALAVSDADLVEADRYEASDYVRILVTLDSGRDAYVYVAREASRR